MKPLKLSGIIHIFALLHAGIASACWLAGTGDELFLTVLTMTMVLLICMKKGLNTEFTAASIIAANIIGYIIGNIGANIFNLFIANASLVHALSTAITTELLGWSIVALTGFFHRNTEHTRRSISPEYLKWLLLAAVGIFCLRIGLLFIFDSEMFNSELMWTAMSDVFSNSIIIITLICFNLLYIRFSGRYLKGLKTHIKSLLLISFSILTAGAVSLLTGSIEYYHIIFTATLLAQITIYCLVFMVHYAISTQIKMKEERDKANLAEYRYVKLKHQINPHFLFNSLNILDCLVCEEKTDQASTYLHKLAGIYRYMIKSEEEQVVSMKEELGFVERYVDLLKVRFPEGLEVNIDVPEEVMARYVLPCSLQLLIENAIKHNAISSENPLIIDVKVNEMNVSVSNNLIPKVTQPQSTGLGQKYIRQLYADLTGKQIDIEKTDNRYCVTLPLI